MVACNVQNHPLCEGYRPHAIRAAQFLAKLETPLYFGEVDMVKSREITTRYNATERPQFIHIYSFGRDPEKIKIAHTDTYPLRSRIICRSIAKAVIERAHIKAIEIKTIEQWEIYSTSISIVILGLFTTTDVSSAFNISLLSLASVKSMRITSVLLLERIMLSSSIHSFLNFSSVYALSFTSNTHD